MPVIGWSMKSWNSDWGSLSSRLVVHALHDQARKFYLHHGFSESAIDPLVLMLHIRQTATTQ
jgi:hypothetical protein